MARLDLLLADAEARFTAYNDTAHGAGVPWSLSSRAYLGFSAMAPEVVEGIRGMSAFFEEGATHAVQLRSEERRVGKECRAWWMRNPKRKKMKYEEERSHT